MQPKQSVLRISFFFLLTFFLVVLTFYNSFHRIATDPQHYTSWVIVHAVSLGVWVMVLLIQPLLIYSSNYKWHKRIGLLSVGLVILVIVSTVLSSLENAEKLPQAWPVKKKHALLFSQLYVMLPFASLYTAAILKAKTFTIHVQCITASLIVILGPVVFRTANTFGLSFFINPELTANILTYGSLNALLVSLCMIHHHKKEGYSPYLLTIAALAPIELAQLWFPVF